MPPKKPPNWEANYDSTTQRWFYQDRCNGVSSWERPAGVNFELPTQPPQVRRTREAEPCPPGWEASFDNASQRYFYFNRETQKRVWTFKIAAPATGTAADASRSPPATNAQAAPSTAAAAARSAPGTSAMAVAASPQPMKQVMAQTGAGASASNAMPVYAQNPGYAQNPAANPNALGLPQAQHGDPRGDGRRRTPSPSPLGRGGKPDRSRNPAADRREALTAWNAEDFIQRVREARSTGDIRSVKPVLVDVSESNYQLRDRWRTPRTVSLAHADLMRRTPAGRSREPEISFSAMTTADAVKHFIKKGGHEVCALNFANSQTVGGGYKNGAVAQEEDLCRRCPTLYTSLNKAQRDGFYPFGPPTCHSPERPEKYCTVLFTPDVVLARGGEDQGFALWPESEQVKFGMVTAAAPNVKGREVYDLSLMYNSIKSVFVAPVLANERTNTLILGAWGCGVFGCDPKDVSELFAQAIKRDRLGRLYSHIHFAIPCFDREDSNSRIFAETLRTHRLEFQELRL